MPLLVRTWNVFHGNAAPPERRGFLREMIELVTADEPDLVCLQEVPLWALDRLGAWSGMQVVGAVARRARVGSADLGRRLTVLHHGLFRSAVAGQANAILAAPGLALGAPTTVTVSRAGERRVLQTVHVEGVGVVANFHVAHGAAADEQFLRVVQLVAARDGAVILGGDANVRPEEGRAYAKLRELGFSQPAPGIDQILVRGLPSATPLVWPVERRRVGRRVLSDHAPVELRVG